MVLRRPRTIAQTCTSTLLVPTQPLVAIAAAYSPHCAQPAHRHLAPQNRQHETLNPPLVQPVLPPPIDPHPRPPPRRLVEGIGQFDLSDPFLTLEYSLQHELRNRMRRLLRRVKAGERIQITVRLAARTAQVFAIQSNGGWR